MSRRRAARLDAHTINPARSASVAATQSVSYQKSFNPCCRRKGSIATPWSHQKRNTTAIGRNRSWMNSSSTTAASAVPAPPIAAQRNPMTNRQANP